MSPEFKPQYCDPLKKRNSKVLTMTPPPPQNMLEPVLPAIPIKTLWCNPNEQQTECQNIGLMTYSR
jgi:hypothetical protein